MTELDRRRKALSIVAGFLAEGGEEFVALFERMEEHVEEMEKRGGAIERARRMVGGHIGGQPATSLPASY